MRYSFLILAVAACVMSACNDKGTTGPGESKTTYVLRAINGRPLPTPRYSSSPSDTVIADTLILNYSRNIATEKITLHYSAGGDGTVTSDSPMVPANGGVTINFGCPANAFCIALLAPSVGTIHGDTLEFVDAIAQDRRTYINPYYVAR